MTDTGRVSDTDTSRANVTASEEHHAGHGIDTGGEPLGPVDVLGWAYALAGATVGVVVALALFVARGG